MHSACVYENTCPMCRLPDTVGGGVSTENTSAFDAGSKRWTPSRSQSSWAARSIVFGSYGWSSMRARENTDGPTESAGPSQAADAGDGRSRCPRYSLRPPGGSFPRAIRRARTPSRSSADSRRRA